MPISYLFSWSLVINTKVNKASSQIATVQLVNFHDCYLNMKNEEEEGKVASKGGNQQGKRSCLHDLQKGKLRTFSDNIDQIIIF